MFTRRESRRDSLTLLRSGFPKSGVAAVGSRTRASVPCASKNWRMRYSGANSLKDDPDGGHTSFEEAGADLFLSYAKENAVSPASSITDDRHVHLLKLVQAENCKVLQKADERCISIESRINMMASDTMVRRQNVCAIRVVDANSYYQTGPIDLRMFPLEAVSAGAKAVTGALAGGVAGLAVGRVIPQLQDALVEGCGAQVKMPQVCTRGTVDICRVCEECIPEEEGIYEGWEEEMKEEEFDDYVDTIFKEIPGVDTTDTHVLIQPKRIPSVTIEGVVAPIAAGAQGGRFNFPFPKQRGLDVPKALLQQHVPIHVPRQISNQVIKEVFNQAPRQRCNQVPRKISNRNKVPRHKGKALAGLDRKIFCNRPGEHVPAKPRRSVAPVSQASSWLAHPVTSFSSSTPQKHSRMFQLNFGRQSSSSMKHAEAGQDGPAPSYLSFTPSTYNESLPRRQSCQSAKHRKGVLPAHERRRFMSVPRTKGLPAFPRPIRRFSLNNHSSHFPLPVCPEENRQYRSQQRPLSSRSRNRRCIQK